MPPACLDQFNQSGELVGLCGQYAVDLGSVAQPGRGDVV
jgi:hypothetical protein